MDLSLVLSRDELELVQQYFHARPERILKRFGLVLLAAASRAFHEQRFGAIEWPERYPNQSGEKLNIAGAVKDLRKNSRLKPRRYDARPVGRDTGELEGSLKTGNKETAIRAHGTIMEVGSMVPYATRFHAGGKSTQIIDREVRSNLAKLLKRLRKKANGKPMEQRRLGFLFQVGELVTESPPRPFTGITDEIREDLSKALQDDLRDFLRSGGAEGGDQ